VGALHPLLVGPAPSSRAEAVERARLAAPALVAALAPLAERDQLLALVSRATLRARAARRLPQPHDLLVRQQRVRLGASHAHRRLIATETNIQLTNTLPIILILALYERNTNIYFRHTLESEK